MKRFILLILMAFFSISFPFHAVSAQSQGNHGNDDALILISVIEKCLDKNTPKLECIEDDLVELGSIVGVVFKEGDKIAIDEIEFTDKVAQRDALFAQVAARLIIFGNENYRKEVFDEATDRAKRMISEENIKGAEELKKVIMLSYMRFCNSLVVLQADTSLYNRLISCFKSMEMDYNQIAEQFRTAVIQFQNEYNSAYERYRETHPSKKKSK